jgi:hypothetical protein
MPLSVTLSTAPLPVTQAPCTQRRTHTLTNHLLAELQLSSTARSAGPVAIASAIARQPGIYVLSQLQMARQPA